MRPRTVLAQAADAGVFQMQQGGAEIGRESFRRSAAGFDQEPVIPVLNLRLAGSSLRGPGGGFAGFTLTVSNVAGDSTKGSYRVEVVGDSVRITSQLGATTVVKMRSGAFDAVLPPQSVATFAELALLAQRHDSTFRLLVVGPDTILPARFRFSGDSVRITFAGLDMLGLMEAGRVTSIDIPGQRVHVVRAAAPESLPPLTGLKRPPPHYGAPADAPFTALDVRVPAGTGADTFSLGCTLTTPKAGTRPYPAMITITGSGSQPRDEELWPLLREYRLFGQVAERLSGEGIAVLRCDDRGAGSSTGHADSATTADLANDTRAQIAWLRSRADIDPARIGLIGHSEGGVIGPLLAAQDRRLAALVILAGPAKPGVEVLVDQARWPVLSSPGLSPDERRARLTEVEAGVRRDSLPANPWFRWFRHYDPIRAAKLVRQPTLILQGALDRQISAGQADTLAAAIREGGNRDVTERTFPRLNHLFLVSETDGSPAEYATLRDEHVPDDVIDAIAAWLSVRLRVAKH
jgi:alpha-beta hydrolase superfamily lysophospholipase